MVEKKIIVITFLIISFSGCDKKSDKVITAPNSIEKIEETNTMKEHPEYLTVDELLKDLPTLSVITAQNGPYSYLGDFYLNESGIASTSYAGGGYKSSIKSVNISDSAIEVYFFLEDIGDENDGDSTGRMDQYYFRLTLAEMVKRLDEDPDGYFIEVKAEESSY